MNLQPYEQQGIERVGRADHGHTIHMSIEQTIAAWLAEKRGKSNSRKTETAYHDGLLDFRATLQLVGCDLDTQPSIVAPLLQGWCSVCKRPGEQVAPSTYNQRRAIVSSFYRYAIKHEVLTVNPAERVELRTISKKDAARPLSPQTVKDGLQSINRKTLEGLRDYAILSLALATGRRASELANLCLEDLSRQGNTVKVLWRRCKGGKQMEDTLAKNTTMALYSYLNAIHGDDLSTLDKKAPVWVSFSDRCKGKPLGVRTLQNICEQHLGTSKMHATRHTWAVTMHHSGASLAEIGKGLGHSNLKTTSDYLDEHLGHENKYAPVLEQIFGI